MIQVTNLYKTVDIYTQKKWVEYLFPLFCILTVLFFNCPFYEGIINAPNPTWILVAKQSAVIFPDMSQLDPTSHEAKRTFRLAIPMLAKLLFIQSRFIIYAIQIIVAYFFFYYARLLFYKILQDKAISFLLSFSLVFLYTGQQFVTDIYAKFDCFAIFFILIAMYYNNALAIFLCVSLTLWTDERGGLMSFFIIPWVLMNQAKGLDKRGLLKIIKDIFDLKIVAFVFAFVCYVALRIYLQHRYHLSSHTDTIHLSDLLRRKNIALFGLWEAFEGLWLVVILSAIYYINNKNYFLLLMLAGITAIVCLSAFIVADITRSMTYLFPLLVISIYHLSKQTIDKKLLLNRAIVYGFVICMIVPTYYSEGGDRIIKPTPFILRLVN